MQSRFLFFYCNAVSDAVRSERGIVTDSPAATRKVVGLCHALRASGVHASIVSMARGGGTRSGRFFSTRVGRLSGVPVIFGPVWDVPILAQLLSAMWLPLCAARLELRRRRSVHLFYNQMSIYLLAMTVLRVLRARVSVDIEDGPITARRTAYSRRLSTLPPSLFARFVSNGALVATSALTSGTPIRPTMIYYGAIKAGATTVRKSFSERRLVAIFTGYLNEDTGLVILAAAIKIMQKSGDVIYDDLVIKVAGMGPGLDTLRALEGSVKPKVEVLGRLDDANFAILLARAHIGLSLKPVAGDVAESTFPSKTVEYAENALALISTDVSDVRALFGDTAFFIEHNDPTELIAHLRQALLYRSQIANIADRARRMIDQSLSYPVIGRKLVDFFFRDFTT